MYVKYKIYLVLSEKKASFSAGFLNDIELLTINLLTYHYLYLKGENNVKQYA